MIFIKKYVVYDTTNDKYISSLYFLNYSTFISPIVAYSAFEDALVFNESFLDETILIDDYQENKRTALIKLNPRLIFKEIEIIIKE